MMAGSLVATPYSRFPTFFSAEAKPEVFTTYRKVLRMGSDFSRLLIVPFYRLNLAPSSSNYLLFAYILLIMKEFSLLMGIMTYSSGSTRKQLDGKVVSTNKSFS